MFIIHYRKFFYFFSGLLIALSLVAMVVYRPWNIGIDFKGGSLLEVAYLDGRPDVATMKEKLGTTEHQLQATGENGYLIRTKALSETERQQLMSEVSDNGALKVEERRFTSIGPTIGAELRSKALWAIALVLLAIVLYVAFAFRHVSRPISSWVYGLVAIIALLHDVFIPTGIYVALGHYFIDVQVDTLFITAILTVLGFSVHDTIVVFDRTRENLKLRTWKEFDETVGHSVEQTFVRSVNTSLTVLLVICALYFVGGETTKNFAMVLGIGVLVGTYSSIFIASPLLVTIEAWQRKREERLSGKR